MERLTLTSSAAWLVVINTLTLSKQRVSGLFKLTLHLKDT